MKKLTLASIILVLLLSPVMMAVADPYVQGDDLIETTFKGTVTDLDSGEPIEDVFVYGFDEEYNEWRSSITDQNGNYYLEFKQGGTFYIYADHDDYHQEEATETVEINTETIVDFELEPKVFDTRIFGVAKDSETGEPLSDVVVNLLEIVKEDENAWLQSVDQTITGEDGKYSFEIYTGNFSLEARKQGYDRIWIEPFHVESGEEYEMDFEMVAWNQGVKGRVTDETGQPMEGIVVSMDAQWFRSMVETDENGEYEIVVPWEGSYTLRAQEEGYRPFVSQVEIANDEMEEIDIEMVESQIPAPILQLVYLILSMLGGL